MRADWPQELPEQQFNTWIKPLVRPGVADDFGGAGHAVRVPNRFKLDWIRAQYAGRIAGVLEKLSGQPVQLELALAPREPPLPASYCQRQPASRACGAAAGEPARPISDDQRRRRRLKNRLNTALTFDTLVQGTANRWRAPPPCTWPARRGSCTTRCSSTAASAWARPTWCTPWATRCWRTSPTPKCSTSMPSSSSPMWLRPTSARPSTSSRSRYHSLDLLLIDDVQFFANKDRTQEEFFNAFEALLAKKSHIVMTSDTYPKGLADIHERLISRFDSGLTVAIEPPELEMRVAILINKARAEGADMPEEVAFFVAKNVRSNVRELEGALRKILAYSRFNQKEIIDRAGARGAARPAVDPEPPDLGGEHPEDGGRLLQDQGRRHVQQEAPGQHRPAAPDRHVPGQGADAEEPARDRRAVRRARPHHGAARGAQDRRRAPAR